jgi:hypothetical protein
MRSVSVATGVWGLLDDGALGPSRELPIDEDASREADLLLENLSPEVVTEGGCRHRHAQG